MSMRRLIAIAVQVDYSFQVLYTDLVLVMVVSPAMQARRALVKLLLVIASVYTVVVNLRRDSPDADVERAFKKVFLKAHPDKGGSEEHAKQLN